MEKFNLSANTGYLWKELDFLERIRMAKKYNFDSVEFHDEARHEKRSELKQVLADTCLTVNSLNIRMEKTFGCAAIPEYAKKIKEDIDEAVDIALDIGANAVHVLAGLTSDPFGYDSYINALQYALKKSELTILIEPVCQHQLPGYFLKTIDQANKIINDINHPNLKILFDCYHVFMESGELEKNFLCSVKNIGHVQIAAAENRSEPFPGRIDYGRLLPEFKKAGYSGAFGCEYRPKGNTEDGLGWRNFL